VQQGDVRPPRAIVPTIDRALEAVCLKAMALKPEDRYGSCRALSEDIERWMADEPVSAWREPLSRWAQRWARQHRPAVTGAAVALFTGLIGLAAGAAVYLQQRQAQVSRLELVLREVNLLRGQAQADPEGDPVKWHLVVAAVKRAEDLLGPLIDAATQRRVRELRDQVASAAQAANRDAVLLREVVDIRSAEADDPDGSASDAGYARAFRDAAIDVDELGPEIAGAEIKARPPGMALALAATLDNWAAVRRDKRRDRAGAERLTQAARTADPDPWRAGLRDALDSPEKQKRLDALRVLAHSAKFDALPPISLDLLGSALRDAGDPQVAESVLRQAERRHPSDVWLNYNLAKCLEKLARREEAIRYYSAARSIRPELAHALAHALEKKGESDEAIAVFQELTRLRPGNGRHLLCLGGVLQNRGRAQEATAALDAGIVAFREDIRKRADDARTRGMLGDGLRLQGKLDEAIAEYREVIRLEPDQADAHNWIGAILCDQKHEYGAAAAEFREAIRLEPDNAWAHNNLGNALGYQGKLEAAAAEFREAIRLEPDHAGGHSSLGNALRKQGKVDEAIAEYKEAIRLQPDYVWAHRNLAEALKSQGKVDEAVAEYKEAIRFKPDYAAFHSVLAEALDLSPRRPRPDYDEALMHARKAVELAPKNGAIVNTLALAEYRSGRWDASIAASERSMSLRNGGDASDWFFLAMAHWQKGEKDEARKWFDKAVAWTKEKDPKNSELRQFWAEAAELLGQPGPDAPRPVSPTAPAVEKPH
jgi:superkiller protein 3